MTLVRKMRIYRYLRGDNCYIFFNKKPTPKGELGCGCTIIVFLMAETCHYWHRFSKYCLLVWGISANQQQYYYYFTTLPVALYSLPPLTMTSLP